MTLRVNDHRSSTPSQQEAKPTTSINDPKSVGPGTWFTIHLKARFADSLAKKREFTEFMWMIAENFKCKVCAEHCRKYLEDHPISAYYDVRSTSKEEIGCFKWSWMFHNAVNNRLGKPIVDWNTAYGMYFTESAVCEVGCDSGIKNNPTPHKGDPEPVALVKSKVGKTPPMVYVIKGDRQTTSDTKRSIMPVFVGRR